MKFGEFKWIGFKPGGFKRMKFKPVGFKCFNDYKYDCLTAAQVQFIWSVQWVNNQVVFK